MSKADKSARAVERLDRAAAETLTPREDSALGQVAGAIGKLGDEPPMLALSGLVLAAGLARGDRRLSRAGGRMLAAELLAIAAKNFGKNRVNRTRPDDYLEDGHYTRKRGHSREPRLRAFPSGHTAGSFAVARAWSREYPEHKGAALLAAGAIGAFQLLRRAHWPSDIVAGAAVGLAAEAVTDQAFKRLPGER